jgi:UDP-2,3-diacylglucosamine pyrophosphatase LpxH
MAKEGTKVIYVPGNHDENIREFCGSLFGNVSIRRRYVHSTADGREFLVLHGDEFDSAVKCSRWLARFGATAYEVMMRINRGVNACRRACGLPHWSLAAYLKLRLANAVRYVEAFEHAAAQAALSRNLDGIVCGHIHRPGLRQIDGVLYCNDGDWVESCTALVELPNGELSIWHSENPYTRRSAESLFEIAA